MSFGNLGGGVGPGGPTGNAVKDFHSGKHVLFRNVGWDKLAERATAHTATRL